MILKVTVEQIEPIKIKSGVDRSISKTISGSTIRGALINAFLGYECKHSSDWCIEDKCPEYNTCIVPNNLLYSAKPLAKVSFLYRTCPKCQDILIQIPRNYLLCKSCMRKEEASDINNQLYQKYGFIIPMDNPEVVPSCPTCKESATLKYREGLKCKECDFFTEAAIYTTNFTGIGIQATTNSTEKGILYFDEAIIPGYQFTFYLETENTQTLEFINSMKDKYIQIGGGRSKGFGTLKINSVDELKKLNTVSSNQVSLISKTIIETNQSKLTKIGDIQVDSILESNGSVSKENGWESNNPGGGTQTELTYVAEEGSLLLLDKTIELHPTQQLIGSGTKDYDGYGAMNPEVEK